MGARAEEYDALLETVQAREPLEGVTLDTESVRAARDMFFKEVKAALEPKLSALALETCFTVERIVSPKKGRNAITLDGLTAGDGKPIAFALQTREDDKDIVRFGTMPVSGVSEASLEALEEADEVFSNETFRR